jgi:hypothetical protein
MSQTASVLPNEVLASNAAQALSNAVSTIVLEIPIPPGVNKLGVQIKPTVRALTAFLVEGKFHPDASYVTITGAITTTPPAPVTSANATLATLAADAIGWFFMDTFGLTSVRVSATCATAADGLITAFAHGATGEDVIDQFSAIGSQEQSAESVAKTMVNGDVVFTIAGGPIQIVDLLSECITVDDVTNSTMQWQSAPTVGTATTISGASGSLGSGTIPAAGATVRLAPTLLSTVPVTALASAGGVQLGTNVANRITVNPGTLKLVIGVGSTTGTWKHRLLYKPLNKHATVTAA